MKRILLLATLLSTVSLSAWAQAPAPSYGSTPPPLPSSVTQSAPLAEPIPVAVNPNSLKYSLTGLIFGEFGLTYARKVGRSTALLIGGGPNFQDYLFSNSLPDKDALASYTNDDEVSTFRTGLWLRGEFRAYMRPGIYPEGTYFGAFIRYKHFGNRYQLNNPNNMSQRVDHDATFNIVDYSVLIGYEKWLGGNFYLDLNGGLGYRSIAYNRLELFETYDFVNNRVANPAVYSDYSGNRLLPFFNVAISYSFQ